MTRETPQAAFGQAQAAMLRGDPFEVFACLDMNDLKRVAANALALSLGARIDEADEEVRRICDEHRFPLDDLLSARQRVMQMPGMEATMNQRDIMKRGPLARSVVLDDACSTVAVSTFGAARFIAEIVWPLASGTATPHCNSAVMSSNHFSISI